MVKFIIVRHGFSLGNKEGRFTGQLDVPLDEIGYAQAECAARHILDNFKIDVIYSSELSRAYDTALPVAKALGLEINRRKGLNEVDVGLWAGKLIDDVEKEFPESFALYKASPGLSHFDGGESYAELRERVVAEFHKLAEENEGKTVLVAVHGGVIRSLVAAWLDIPLERLTDVPRASNASITVAEYETGKAKLKLVGYTGHLENKATEKVLN